MDATRADVEFTAEVVQIAHRRGRDDDQHPRHRRLRDAARVRRVPRRGSTSSCPGLRDVVLSVHCHDDLGLAVANSFAGVRAGARQVECAINGIGERAGNASLEEIVMLLHTRGADVGLRTGVDTREIARTSRLVLAPDRLRRAAQQGDRRAATRSRTSPASTRTACSRSARPTRSWTRRTVGLRRRTRSCSASTPAATRCSQALQELGFEVDGPDAQPGVQALQGDRGQEEAGDRDGPRGARHRRAARRGDAPTRSSGSTSRRPRAGRRTRRSASRTPDGDEVDAAPSPATARSTRSSAPSTPPPAARRGCGSSASTRSPAARTRSARRWCSSSSWPARPRPARACRPTSSRPPRSPTCARSRTLTDVERTVIGSPPRRSRSRPRSRART